MPKLRRVISGGQTGADQAGLASARFLGLETGGTATLSYRTEDGRARDLLRSYGLVESQSYDYRPRTWSNVINADVTLWFGTTDSPGFTVTKAACISHGKPFFENPTKDEIEDLVVSYETWNVAGNRHSRNPQVAQLVYRAFRVVCRLMEE